MPETFARNLSPMYAPVRCQRRDRIRQFDSRSPRRPANSSRFYKMVGNSRQAVDMIVVPQRRDYRLRSDPSSQPWEQLARWPNRWSLDKPADDTHLYLEHANNFASATMTKNNNNWRPGQLIAFRPLGRDNRTSFSHIDWARHAISATKAWWMPILLLFLAGRKLATAKVFLFLNSWKQKRRIANQEDCGKG